MVDPKSIARNTVRRGTSHKVRRTMPHRDKTKYTRRKKHDLLHPDHPTGKRPDN